MNYSTFVAEYSSALWFPIKARKERIDPAFIYFAISLWSRYSTIMKSPGFSCNLLFQIFFAQLLLYNEKIVSYWTIFKVDSVFLARFLGFSLILYFRLLIHI